MKFVILWQFGKSVCCEIDEMNESTGRLPRQHDYQLLQRGWSRLVLGFVFAQAGPQLFGFFQCQFGISCDLYSKSMIKNEYV